MHIGGGHSLWNLPFSHISDTFNLHLDLGSGHLGHTAYHCVSLIDNYLLYVPNYLEMGKTFSEQMDVWTDIETGITTLTQRSRPEIINILYPSVFTVRVKDNLIEILNILNDGGITRCSKCFKDMFSCFDTILDCDKRMNGHTAAQTPYNRTARSTLCISSCG